MKEWIVTNGLGGFSSLTYQNTNTRKFHGLLISSLNPPTERWCFITNVFDQVKLNGITFDLRVFKPIYTFDYFPCFIYNFENVQIKKTVFMQHFKNTTIIKYDIKTNKPITLFHRPVVNSRHFYDLNQRRDLFFEQKPFKDGVKVKPENTDKEIKIFLKDSCYNSDFIWEEFYYKLDHERGDSWIDNNAIIGDFKKEINKNCEYFLILTTENKIPENPGKIYLKEIDRKKKIFNNSNLPKKFEKLVLSSDRFIVNKKDSKSVIAGYHWFGDWGRDTLISLPGLTLVTKRFDDAKKILQNFADYSHNGLIPNAFMERDSQPVYNTVDASLWYIDRVLQYLKYTNDISFVEKNWGILKSIIDGYKNGTEYGIHMDTDYLISHNPGLTWMDVKLDNYYPTPRDRKAVEIQALWYNALKIMAKLSDSINKDDLYSSLALKVEDSFITQFDDFYDVIDRRDSSFRSNLIFLVSLDFNMIDKTLQKKIVENVEDKLLTVFGLKTLSSDHPEYKGKYLGDYNKDLAYHNGTVWPWLLGPFITSYIKTHGNTTKNRNMAYKNFLQPMLQIFGEEWDGNINEIFDGDPPHTKRGCITQAWSVAEILRAWVEDIENIKPSFNNVFLNKIRV